MISKIDQLKNRDELYPFVAKIAALYQFDAVVPVSSTKKHQLDQLLDEVSKRLPENEAYFDADTLTDRPIRFIASELIREKIFDNKRMPEIRKKIEGVDISTLDQGHVIPNMRSPIARGVWFPIGFD